MALESGELAAGVIADHLAAIRPVQGSPISKQVTELHTN